MFKGEKNSDDPFMGLDYIVKKSHIFYLFIYNIIYLTTYYNRDTTNFKLLYFFFINNEIPKKILNDWKIFYIDYNVFIFMTYETFIKISTA